MNQSPEPKSAGRRSPGFLLALLVIVFGLAMAAFGFLAGRATASRPASEQAVAGVTTQSPVSADLPVAGAPAAELASPTAAPTELPSATPSPAPTVQPATVTPVPTAEVTPETETPTGANFSLFNDVWQLIADQYDGAMPPSNEVMESAIAGSLRVLGDEHTRFVPADVAAMMQDDAEGAVEGIGAYVRETDEGFIEIARPIDGQPADLAGLKPGDIIVAVDGQSVVGLSLDEVVLLVRGPQGTSVMLGIAREGEAEPIEFVITRARYEVPVVESEMLPPEVTGGADIGYVRLAEFNRIAEERLLEALNVILSQNPTGLVFDLRDNPGGFLDQSVAVADAFLPEGVALFERNIRGLDQTFVTDNGDIAESIPLVVLVNTGSASASEIVAGAIQDRGRGVLVGETTFGKGSVQQVYPLEDGSELRVTVARWYTPNDHTIDDEGIKPDFEVASPEDLGGPEDGQLMRAVQFLVTGQ